MIQHTEMQTPKRTQSAMTTSEKPTEVHLVSGFKWIVIMPGYLGGRPAIYGKRMSVEQVLQLLAEGTTADELKEHYELDQAATKESLLYASKVVEAQRPLCQGI